MHCDVLLDLSFSDWFTVWSWELIFMVKSVVELNQAWNLVHMGERCLWVTYANNWLLIQVLVALRKCAVKNEEDAEMAHAVAAHLVRALVDYKDFTGREPFQWDYKNNTGRYVPYMEVNKNFTYLVESFADIFKFFAELDPLIRIRFHSDTDLDPSWLKIWKFKILPSSKFFFFAHN